MAKKILFIAFVFFTASFPVSAQQVDFSLPAKLPYGTNEFEILGRNKQGIIVQLSSRTLTTIEVYSPDMKLKWKKNINLKEPNASVSKIFLSGDSALIFYSLFIKGSSVLKAMAVNEKFETTQPAVTLDSVSVFNYNNAPVLSYILSPDKSKCLVYYADNNSSPKNTIHAIMLDVNLNLLWKYNFKAQYAEQPVLIAALADDSAKAWFLTGDNQAKNFKNDFPYLNFQLYHYGDSTGTLQRTDLYADGKLMTEPVMRMDRIFNNIIIAGLYANDPGTQSNGTYYFCYSMKSNQITQNKSEPYPEELLVSLSGNSPPKRNDGFYNFKPQEMIVRKDGGAIFIAEASSVSLESFASPGYGGFGVTSPLTVSYYHFDDILAVNFSPEGKAEWQKTFTKRQQTEGDGGYYSSFSIFIGPSALQLVYNDFVSGMIDLSAYRIGIDGASERKVIFNAVKKGVLPVSKYGRQISVNEFLVPSIKRGYLQFIKITF